MTDDCSHMLWKAKILAKRCKAEKGQGALGKDSLFRQKQGKSQRDDNCNECKKRISRHHSRFTCLDCDEDEFYTACLACTTSGKHDRTHLQVKDPCSGGLAKDYIESSNSASDTLLNALRLFAARPCLGVADDVSKEDEGGRATFSWVSVGAVLQRALAFGIGVLTPLADTTTPLTSSEGEGERRSGDGVVVAVAGGNTVDFFVAYFGCIVMGLVPIVVDPVAFDSHLLAALKKLGCSVVVGQRDLIQKLLRVEGVWYIEIEGGEETLRVRKEASEEDRVLLTIEDIEILGSKNSRSPLPRAPDSVATFVLHPLIILVQPDTSPPPPHPSLQGSHKWKHGDT